MKINIVSLHYAPEVTGNAPYVTSLAKGLAARGHDVHVLCSMPFYPAWQVDERYSERSRVELLDEVTVVRKRHWIPRRPIGVLRLLSEVSAGLKLRRRDIRDCDVALFVSPALFHSRLAILKRGTTPSVIWLQDMYSLGVRETSSAGGLIARALTWIEAGTLRRVDRVVTIHDRFSRYVADTLGVAHEKVEAIRNWSHISESRASTAPGRDKSDAQTEYIVLHAGNQGVKQGLENVVAAARVAEQRGLPIRFVLMGDGNQHDSLVRLAEGAERVTFSEPVSDDRFMETLKSANALLVNERPGLIEMSVPSKLTSYFAAGLPVIAASESASITAEEVRLSGAGVVVPSGEPELLVDAISDLMANPEAAAALGRNGPVFRDAELRTNSALDKFERILIAVANREHANA